MHRSLYEFDRKEHIAFWVAELVDLRDLAEHLGKVGQFEGKIEDVKAQFGKSKALMDRMTKAKLV